MTSAFTSWSEFWAMGGWFYVWLAVALTLIPILLLCLHTYIQRK